MIGFRILCSIGGSCGTGTGGGTTAVVSKTNITIEGASSKGASSASGLMNLTFFEDKEKVLAFLFF